MEIWDGFHQELARESGSPYQYSMLAIELLASMAGQDALIDFVSLVNSGAAWRQAFEISFGLPVETFYDEFCEHRDAGFPNR